MTREAFEHYKIRNTLHVGPTASRHCSSSARPASSPTRRGPAPSCSQAEEDIVRSYALHANAYVTKPVDFERFIDVIRQIDSFFITVVELPI